MNRHMAVLLGSGCSQSFLGIALKSMLLTLLTLLTAVLCTTRNYV